MFTRLNRFWKVIKLAAGDPARMLRIHHKEIFVRRGFNFAYNWIKGSQAPRQTSTNPLREYFNAHETGKGIWKWDHYFDIYHDHFKKFIGKEVHVVEVGVYKGGSLAMWKEYLGDACQVYGIDNKADCKQFEEDRIQVYIGDQADRSFWKAFRKKVPRIDILIDDGGHQTEQQIVTLEELLPHMSPGGVYLCEDIHGIANNFLNYISGMQRKLQQMDGIPGPMLQSNVNHFQRDIYAIHTYPWVVVIEKRETPADQFFSPRKGSNWVSFGK